MIHKSLPLPLLLCLATIFFPTSAAAPLTRAHCRCSRLSTSNDNPLFTSTSNSFLSTQASNPCASLALSLEHLRLHEPATYDSIFTAHESPMPSIPLDLSSRTRPYSNLGNVISSSGSLDPTPRPLERIVCTSEPEPMPDFQDSKTTLFALQVIVGMAFLACAAELVSLLVDWFSTGKESKPVKLSGAEKLLTAHVDPNADQLFSPGVQKKLQAYAIQEQGQRNFERIEDGDDDELNWPVL